MDKAKSKKDRKKSQKNAAEADEVVEEKLYTSP